MNFFLFLQKWLFPEKFKPHLTVQDEFQRLRRCSSRERIIGYDKIFRIIIGAEDRPLISRLQKHRFIPAKPDRINQVRNLHERRNMLVHRLNNVSETTLTREANSYEVLVRKYMKHYKK